MWRRVTSFFWLVLLDTIHKLHIHEQQTPIVFFKIESIENETFGVEMLPAENNKHFNKLTTATELSSRKLAFRYIQEVYTYFLLDI